MPDDIDKLKILTRAGIKIGEDNFTNFDVKSSWPVELLFFKLEIAFLISICFILYKNKDWLAGSFK